MEYIVLQKIPNRTQKCDHDLNNLKYCKFPNALSLASPDVMSTTKTKCYSQPVTICYWLQPTSTVKIIKLFSVHSRVCKMLFPTLQL